MPADIPTLNQNTTGNAATASALAATPSQCTGGQFATGIASNGNATCATPSGGGGGSSLFTQVQVDVNPSISGTGNYWQIASGTGLSSNQSGAGTSASPYLTTFNVNTASSGVAGILALAHSLGGTYTSPAVTGLDFGPTQIPLSGTAPTANQCLATDATGTHIIGTSCGSGGGAGTVTAVAMTGDGTIFNTTVTGSPVTTSGTLAPTLATQTAHAVLIGPSTGDPAAPTFRALTVSDLPAGIGTVTSIGMTGDGTVFNPSVTGSPLSTSGTLAPTLVSQAPNTVLAGPPTGSTNAAPTFRPLVAADLGAPANPYCEPMDTTCLVLNEEFVSANSTTGTSASVVGFQLPWQFLFNVTTAGGQSWGQYGTSADLGVAALVTPTSTQTGDTVLAHLASYATTSSPAFGNIGNWRIALRAQLDGTTGEVFRAGVCAALSAANSSCVAPGSLVTVTVTSGGTGYAVGDIVSVTGGGGAGGQVKVLSVSSGAVTALAVSSPGSGYALGSGFATAGGTGSGLTVQITVVGSTNLIAIRYDTSQSDSGFVGEMCNNTSGCSATAPLCPADTNAHTFVIYSTTARTVNFNCDGGSFASLSTNFPTVGLAPSLWFQSLGTTQHTIKYYFYKLKQWGLAR